MAPLYDLLSTAAYTDLSPKMAMRFGERATLAEMDSDGWQAFAKDAGVGLRLLRRRIAELCGAVLTESGGAASSLCDVSDSQAIPDINGMINDRARMISMTLG